MSKPRTLEQSRARNGLASPGSYGDLRGAPGGPTLTLTSEIPPALPSTGDLSGRKDPVVPRQLPSVHGALALLCAPCPGRLHRAAPRHPPCLPGGRVQRGRASSPPHASSSRSLLSGTEIQTAGTRVTGGPLQARTGLGTTQGCGEPAAHCDPLGAQPTEGKSWALAQGHAALGGGPGDPPGTTRGQGSGSAARRWGCAPVRRRPRTRHGDPGGSPPTHWRGPALRREAPPWHRTHRGPRDPRGGGAASSGRHEPRGQAPTQKSSADSLPRAGRGQLLRARVRGR